MQYRLRFVHPVPELCATGRWLPDTAGSYSGSVDALQRAYEDVARCIIMNTEGGKVAIPADVLGAGVMFIDTQMEAGDE